MMAFYEVLLFLSYATQWLGSCKLFWLYFILTVGQSPSRYFPISSIQVIEVSAKPSEDQSGELDIKWCVVGAAHGEKDFESEV